MGPSSAIAEVGHQRIGDVLNLQGDHAGALKAYQAYLELAGRLAAANPTNASAQSVLASGHRKVADALEGQGDLDGALKDLAQAWR